MASMFTNCSLGFSVVVWNCSIPLTFHTRFFSWEGRGNRSSKSSGSTSQFTATFDDFAGSRTGRNPGLWSRNSNFRLWLQTSIKFLARTPKWLGPLKTENHALSICTTSLPHKHRTVVTEPQFQAPAPPHTSFWLRLHSPGATRPAQICNRAA